MTIRNIFGSIVKNYSSGGKCLISEAIVDTVGFHIYCSGDDLYEVFRFDLDQIAEEHDGLAEARQLIRNLEDTHIKMR